LPQQKEALDINEETFASQKRKANRKALLDKIEVYRNWLLRLTIWDPALVDEQQKWLQYFEEQKAKANSVQQVIQQTDTP